MFKVIKKVIQYVVLILAVSFASFFVTNLAPGDAAQKLLESKGQLVTEEALEHKREEMGLNRPMIVQYGDWLSKAVRGDLGISFKNNKTVMSQMVGTMPNTALLTFSSIGLSILMSVPLAMAGALRKNGVLDRTVGIITYILVSFPDFFVSLGFLYLFAGKLGWFNVIGGDRLIDAVLPITVLALITSAWLTRQIRSILLKEYNKDYVMAYRAKGADERTILRKHVLRNCLLPIITLVGISFGTTLGGTIIVENIFNWSGMGDLIMKAIRYRDFPVIQAYTIFMSLSLLLVNGFIDILYYVLDPRKRNERRKRKEGTYYGKTKENPGQV